MVHGRAVACEERQAGRGIVLNFWIMHQQQPDLVGRVYVGNMTGFIQNLFWRSGQEWDIPLPVARLLQQQR